MRGEDIVTRTIKRATDNDPKPLTKKQLDRMVRITPVKRLRIELGLSHETDPRLERPRLRCFVTNVVRCNPPANRTPTRVEIAQCKPYLWQELTQLQPRIVVPLGNVAARALFPRLVGRPATPITQAHAQVFSRDGVWLVPMRHPARISNADLQRFSTALRPLLGTPSDS